MNFNDENNPLFKIVQLIDMLLKLSIMSIVAAIIMIFLSDDEYIKGQWVGICIYALLVAVSIISVLMSMLSKDDIDEIQKMIEDEIEQEKREQDEK